MRSLLFRDAPEACDVLVADDDRALCRTLRDVLETRRHRVEVVYRGSDALAACAARDFDVLLLDISLPDLSGLDLISQVEEIRPRMDVLVITGHASLEGAVQAVSRSTIGYLVKPLDLDRLLGILEGIARRKRIAIEKEALIHQLEETNAELERYTYTVSHDLKSPLITITGFLGLIKKSAREGDFEQMEADIARVERTAQRMQQLLDQLLKLSRIGRIQNPSEEVSLRDLATEAVALVMPPDGGRDVEVDVAPDLPVVRGDRVRLLQVFQNLVDNAVKFMGDEPRPAIEIGARTRAGETVLFVRDNGVGIDPRYHKTVFGLFGKIEKESDGTGIGLALVKRIVEVHGGRIWVESAGGGKGSSFCFTLPGTGDAPAPVARD